MTRVTCHVTTVTTKKMADDEDADAFMLLYFLTAKQHKSGQYGSAVGHSTGKQFAGRTFHRPIVYGKLNHALEVGRLYRSSDVGLTNDNRTKQGWHT